MSEVIVQPGTQARTVFGLQIINEQPIRLSQDAATTPVTVTGSGGKSSLTVTSSTSSIVYNIQAGTGDDTITTAAAADTLAGNAGNDVINAGAGNDSIAGGLGVDTLFAGVGDDLVTGDDGNDAITGAEGNDDLTGGTGNDTISGDAGNDIIRGGAGNDKLSGGAGNDNIQGNDGNDILNPGAGNDTLTGGKGKDTFRFDQGAVGGKLDVVKDFNPADDTIEISRKLLPGSGLKKGLLNNATFEVVRGIGSADTSAKIVYDSSSGIVYYNPSRGSDVPLFKLQKNLDVSAKDFRIF